MKPAKALTAGRLVMIPVSQRTGEVYWPGLRLPEEDGLVQNKLWRGWQWRSFRLSETRKLKP